MSMPTRPRVIIVGAGFGGLNAARAFRGAPIDVTLVDRHNYHLFQPLLYQVATAGLDAEEIAQSVRDVFQGQENVSFRLGTVAGVDWEAAEVVLEAGEPLPFDYLILAAGASTADYGVEGVREHAFTVKHLDGVVALRSHVLEQFERAERDPAVIDDGALTFVLCGGGPTGVEMAGAFVELFERVLQKDFRGGPVRHARVVLVEMGDALLPSYAPSLRAYARRTLEARGVEVRLETAVERVTEGAAHLASGEVLPTRTFIWAAGVRASPLVEALELEQAQGGRAVVEPDLRLPGHPNAFAIGDLAAARDAEGQLLPGVAQVAIQGGRHAARTILRAVRGEPGEAFAYTDLGEMATIGRSAAVAEFPNGLQLKGFVGWAAWLLVHLVQLVGFRNRLNVLVNWTWNYFTYDRSARLISGSLLKAAERPMRKLLFWE